MLSDVKINEELSILKFGSIPKNSGSHKLCCVECLACNKIIDREYRNIGRKHQCSVVDGNTKKCMRCGEWKDFTLFAKNSKLSGGVSKVCKKCYNSYECVLKYNKLKSKRLKSCFVDDFDLWINKRFSQLKARCKSQNIDIDITTDELKSLWTQQGGKCYYSGLEMIADGRVNGFQGWRCPSVDRKTPNLGYVSGNVVWCCFSINSFKQSLTESEFIEQIKQINWYFNKN